MQGGASIKQGVVLIRKASWALETGWGAQAQLDWVWAVWLIRQPWYDLGGRHQGPLDQIWMIKEARVLGKECTQAQRIWEPYIYSFCALTSFILPNSFSLSSLSYLTNNLLSLKNLWIFRWVYKNTTALSSFRPRFEVSGAVAAGQARRSHRVGNLKKIPFFLKKKLILPSFFSCFIFLFDSFFLEITLHKNKYVRSEIKKQKENYLCGGLLVVRWLSVQIVPV